MELGKCDTEGIEHNPRFPYLVIRWMAAVYGRKDFIFVVGDHKFSMNQRSIEVTHPAPFDHTEQIAADCKSLILKGVLEAVKTSRFRMCVVWGPKSCTYVESDGNFNHSSEPPSGGVVLNCVRVSVS